MFLQVLPEVKKDGPFFSVVGFVCGLIQYLGYNYFDKAEWGSELLKEHIAFGSIAVLIVFLWLCCVILRWKPTFLGRDYLDQLVTHISERAVAFALVAAFVIIGFGLAALLFKSYGNAVKFLFAGLYFIALAELAANPRIQNDKSTCYWPAFGFVIATPFSF